MNNEVIENIVTIETIHYDLQLMNSFLIFFVIVILCYFTYKFFDMFWKI